MGRLNNAARGAVKARRVLVLPTPAPGGAQSLRQVQHAVAGALHLFGDLPGLLDGFEVLRERDEGSP